LKFHHPDRPSSFRVFPTKRSLLFSMPGSRPRIVANGNWATACTLPNDTIPNGAAKGVYTDSFGEAGSLHSFLMFSTTTPACLPARNPCLISCRSRNNHQYHQTKCYVAHCQVLPCGVCANDFNPSESELILTGCIKTYLSTARNIKRELYTRIATPK
jgi:hypothetical protein